MASITNKDRVPYKIWDKVNSVWNKLNFLTNAKSVDAADGKSLETKVGAINGITSDLSGEAEDIAASIKCVNQLNSSLSDLKDFQMKFHYDRAINVSFSNGNGRVTHNLNLTSNDYIVFVSTNDPERSVGVFGFPEKKSNDFVVSLGYNNSTYFNGILDIDYLIIAK